MEYVSEFTVSAKAMRMMMDIAAAAERYNIVMEGPKIKVVRKSKVQVGRKVGRKYYNLVASDLIKADIGRSCDDPEFENFFEFREKFSNSRLNF